MKNFKSLYCEIVSGGEIHKGYLVTKSNVDIVIEQIEQSSDVAWETFLSSSEPVNRLDHELYLLQGISKAIGTLAVMQINLFGVSALNAIRKAKELYLNSLLTRLQDNDILINLSGGFMPLNTTKNEI